MILIPGLFYTQGIFSYRSHGTSIFGGVELFPKNLTPF